MSAPRITRAEVEDIIRFPTSLRRDGSDAMKPDPECRPLAPSMVTQTAW